MIALDKIRTLGKLYTPKAQSIHNYINSPLHNYISDEREITIYYTFIHNILCIFILIIISSYYYRYNNNNIYKCQIYQNIDS